MIFALISASYVYREGVASGKNHYKLIVECLLIITAVVPPELPIQLSLAVNNSLIALSKVRITCTEPFRIPIAGKLDVCCFDKTGTLTSDKFVVKGLAGLIEKSMSLVKPPDIFDVSPDVVFALAGCHSLATLENGTIVGDPLEVATLDAIKWTFTQADIAKPLHGPTNSIRVLSRFHFSSTLKRMSVVMQLEHLGKKRIMFACKGAPDVMKDMFASPPVNYDAILRTFSERGARVLAVGYRIFDNNIASPMEKITREQTERCLDFGGFLIVSSPLIKESSLAVKVLLDAGQEVVMITGDETRTAVYVASTLFVYLSTCPSDYLPLYTYVIVI